MHRRRRQVTDFIEPDLPIVPMLDMSFQLLAFFVMTFNPTPAEGHLEMALPLIEGGKSDQPPPPSDHRGDIRLKHSTHSMRLRCLLELRVTTIF